MTPTAEPFTHTSGPRDARVVLVGEAHGESEERLGKPFAGYSGKELFRMLWEVWSDIDPVGIDMLRHMRSHDALFIREREDWLAAAGLLMTNTFALRPPANNMEALCASKKEVAGAAPGYALAPIKQGKYIRPEYLPELDRLGVELSAHPRHLVVALGNTACWALLGSAKIGSLRGAVATGGLRGASSWKVLPTYHPAAVCRLWSYRPIVVADLMKARREGEYHEIRRPSRRIVVNPTLDEIAIWASVPATQYAVDIETKNGQIEMISFARARDDALVVPFIVPAPGGRSASYWSEGDEICAWEWVECMLSSGARLLFQNGVFDVSYLYRAGLRLRGACHDTMLMQHSQYPELQKGLGFLGSIFCSEPAWKLLRSGKHEELKREE